MFLSLGIAILANLLVALLQPTPEFAKPKKYGLSEFSLPTATEDRAATMIFGTVPVAGNLVWSGDYLAQEMTRTVDTGLFSSAEQTYGYRYHIGMWLSLCGTTVDSLEGVLWGDRDAWTGSQALSRTAATDVPVAHIFTSSEGQEVPDGFIGTLRFFNQEWSEGSSFTPLSNEYMQAQLGLAQVPAYPGTCHAVFLGPSVGGSGFVGAGPNIPALQVVLKRLPAVKSLLQPYIGAIFSEGGPTFTYPLTGPLEPGGAGPFVNAFIDSVADIDGDANPAFVIAELLAARMAYVGPRLTPHALDWDSVMRAAETLKNEGHGVSFAWEESRSVGEVITDVCKQINATLQADERTGRLRLRLIRESDAVLHHFDVSNVIEFRELTRTRSSSTPSEVQVPYSDRSLRYETRTAIAKNIALAQQMGTVVSRSVDFIGVSNARLASILATREVRSSAASLAQLAFTAALPPAVNLKPGDVVTVDHPAVPVTLRMRVSSVRMGDYSRRGEVEFETVEDVFRDGSEVYTSNPGLPVDPSTSLPTPASSAALIAAPYALSGDDYDRPLYFAEATDATATALRLSVSRESTSWDANSATYAADTVRPAIAGTLAAVLTSFVSGGTSATLNLTAGAAAAFRGQPLRGECLAIVGDEWISCAGASLTGTSLLLSSIKRGVFDTVQRRHAAGTKVTLLLGYSLANLRMQTRMSTAGAIKAGVITLSARADTTGRGGTVPSVDAPTTAATLVAASTGTSRAVAPLPPVNVRIGATASVGSPLDPVSSFIRSASSTLTWNNRNRLSRSNDSAFSAFNDPEPGAAVEYAIDWETTAGSGTYTSNPVLTSAVGASSATVNTSGIPAGARSVRVKLRATRPSAGGMATSAEHDWYFVVT